MQGVKHALGALVVAAVAFAAFREPKVIAEVKIPKLVESSGIVASRRYANLFWTHNDSGAPLLFAFDRNGRQRAMLSVAGTRIYDWEGISFGPGPAQRKEWLYIGDIGDNLLRRKLITVYRIPEPDPNSSAAATPPAESFHFEYPDGPHDAECLLVHPQTGDLYIVTKARGEDSVTRVYKARAPLKPLVRTRLQQIAELDLPNTSVITLILGRITGGDISRDGRRVVLCDYFRGWEASLPSGEKSFDVIWESEWRDFELGGRQQGEGICYRHDGKAVLTTSEGSAFPLIEVERAP